MVSFRIQNYSFILMSLSISQDSMTREAQAQAVTYATKDFLEGVTAVKEKRNPSFTGK